MEIRLAKFEDIENILALNEKFNNYYHSNRFERGFLTNRLAASEVEFMINESCAVVTIGSGRTLCGYYITSSRYPVEKVISRQNIIKELIRQGNIPDGRYSYFTQAAVDEDFMNKGYAKQMLALLRKTASINSDYLVGWVSFKNITAKMAHEKSGWDTFYEDGSGYLLSIPTCYE
ncbi:hypothetical protein [Dyadobacter luticola]|uniref:GNAT family N-acetyltransferase n=1 Tax=Dyadobacter luticola TaxID=1979387 RepID=A0A5R9KZ15_9BACT|nr:hypothetical protein [Dyadobacter luticola]TLV01335.1 hypothetical protein FEN17_18030 [Dyadobacter luticola]